MGWAWLAVIGIAAFGTLWLCGVSRALGGITAAALLLGAAGYALQNNASAPASLARTDINRSAVDPGLVTFRSAIMPITASSAAMLAAADERLRDGDTGGGAAVLLGAVKQAPDDAALWTGLGSVIVAHDGGQISPAARYAFRRAALLAPDQPGPSFFLGMAHVQAGDLAAAKQAWLLSLSLSPRDAPYRVDIAERLVMVDQFMAMQAAEASAR